MKRKEKIPWKYKIENKLKFKAPEGGISLTGRSASFSTACREESPCLVCLSHHIYFTLNCCAEILEKCPTMSTEYLQWKLLMLI